MIYGELEKPKTDSPFGLGVRVLLTAAIVTLVAALGQYILRVEVVQLQTEAAVAQLDDDWDGYARVQTYKQMEDWVNTAEPAIIVLVIAAIWYGPILRVVKRGRTDG